MKLTFYKSAGVLVESGESRILCDPWLEDGAYYGAWAHVPPCDVTAEEIGRLDGIYITHIHPDHLHKSTLAKFDKTIPVYIHRYAFRYLHDAIADMGFTVHEVANAASVPVGYDLWLTIYAADNCDPSVCGQFFGCDARVGAERPGSVQIDSLAVISDGKHSIVNVNDCPFELAQYVIPDIQKAFGNPDLLLVNYVGAGPFPQCMQMPENDKRAAAEHKKEQFLVQAGRYIDALEPAAFMPFAGTYVLAGGLAALNEYRGVPTMKEAAEELGRRHAGQSLYLTTRQSYDLSDGSIVGHANEWTDEQVTEYVADELAGRSLDYELEPYPHIAKLQSHLHLAGQRFLTRCQEVGFTPSTDVYIGIDDHLCYKLPTPDRTGRVMKMSEARCGPRVILSCDPRLLMWLLTGKAHWQDATIGSHIMFDREPQEFDRGLEFCLNDLVA